MVPSAANPSGPDPRFRRLLGLVWLLLLMSAVVMLLRPPLSLPETAVPGIAALGFALLLGLVTGVMAWRRQGVRAVAVPTAAGWAGGLFLAGSVVRWAAGSGLYGGLVTMATLTQAAAAAAASALVLAAFVMDAPEGERVSAAEKPLLALHALIGGAAVLSALHGAAQYVWLYPEMHERLLAEIGAREPTPIEIGLLHHMEVKRVASVWGDPNSLAALLAAGTASLYALGCAAGGLPAQARTAARAGLAVSGGVLLAAIGLTGSRGGLLVLAGVCVLMAVHAWRGARDAAARRALVVNAGAVLPVAVLAAVLMTGAVRMAVAPVAGDAEADAAPLAEAAGRTSTIRERVFYLSAGARLIAESPLAGNEWGGVEAHFGRVKPPEARETRYLHNWPVQIAAEAGVPMALLAVALVVLLLARGWRDARPETPGAAGAAMIVAALAADGLVQHSLHQRELMLLFGLCCGPLLLRVEGSAGRSGVRMAAVWSAGAAAGVAFLYFALCQREAAAAVQQARAHQEAGEHSQARRAFVRAVQFAKSYPEVQIQLMRYEAEARGPAAALRYADAQLRLSPHSAALHSEAARLYGAAGETPRALELVRRAIELYPAKSDYRMQLAQLLEASGDFAGALTEAELAVQYAYFYPEVYADYLAGLRARAAGAETEP